MAQPSCSVCYCSEEKGAEKAAYCREATGAPWRPLGEVMWRGGGEGAAAAVSGAGVEAPGRVGGQRLGLGGGFEPRGGRALWSRRAAAAVGFAPRGGRTAL